MADRVQASIAVISFPKTLVQLENFLDVDERSRSVLEATGMA